MESAPPMGLLQRALSKRSGLGVAPKQADPLDASKHLEHIPEDALDSDVTGSSVAAVSTFLASDQFKNSVRNFTPLTAPAYGGDSGNDDSQDGGGVDGNAEGGEVPSDDDDDDDEPPPERRLVSSQGISGSGSRTSGTSGRLDSFSADAGVEAASAVAAKSSWTPNMELDLESFDQDAVSYLAEGAMCQCFLARTLPASMNVPDGGNEGGSINPVFKNAMTQGVVIKTPTEGPNQAMSENDLIVESQLLRELSHPHIVSLLGAGETHTGASFIVLEYLSMGTLRGRLDKCGGGLGLGPAIKYGQQLASALSYMHDGAWPGIIVMHRDLKPDNIGFDVDGRAKLMDFGLAKIIERKQRCGSLKYRMTGETGSPRYMPPEVATSQKYNEKADVWSFMVIVWEMVSGRLPFAGMSMEMYLAQVCDGGERPLVQNHWPADFKTLLRSSWQKEADKRPSFREIHAVLSGMHKDMNKPKKKTSFFGKK